MLSQSLLSGMRVLRTEARRNFGIVAPALNKASDPIQQLFLDKVREYKQKSADGKTDMLKFPEFQFPDVKVDPITQAPQ
ncbi:uncharacterized protein Dere_GG12440, isoform D [Drosophila erecta]|nr:uncharacterized protein Dere_GG12440, isoform D [Drosophila erecta]